MYSVYYGLRNPELKNENKARVWVAYAEMLLEPEESAAVCFDSVLKRLSDKT